MAKTNHGVMLISASPAKVAYAKIGAGEMHSYFIYYFPDQENIRTNVFSLNHDTDVAANIIQGAIEGPLGRPNEALQHPITGDIFYGTFINKDVPGNLAWFDFESLTTVESINVPGPAGGGNQDGIIHLTWGDDVDKTLHCLTTLKGGYFTYNPVTGIRSDLSILDDPEGVYADYYRYGGSIQVDTTHAYIAFKENTTGMTAEMYLIKKQLSDGAETIIWKGEGCSEVYVLRGGDENIYVTKKVGAVTTWYAITDFVNPLGTPYPSCYGANTRSSIVYTGYSRDNNLAYPDGRGGKTVPFYYKRPDDEDYRLVTADLISVDDYEVRRAGIDFDGSLICFADAYGSITKLTAAGGKEVVGVCGLSGYSVGIDRRRRKVYLCGYPRGNDFEWNPALSWDYPASNPKKLNIEYAGLSSARYTRGVHQGSDGLMWFGFDWVRISGETRNSDIGWLDPDTELSGLISATVPGAGGDANLNTYNLENFARDRSGLRMVFSGYTTTDSVLAVIPVWKKGVSKYLRPIAGGARQGRIVNVGTSKATGNHFVGVTVGASYKVYCVDIGTGALVWGPFDQVGTSSFLDGEGPLFAHNYVWYFVGNDIYRIDPTDGTVTKAYDGSDNGIVAGGLYWPPANTSNEDSLYHWETVSKNVFEIPKADLGVV